MGLNMAVTTLQDAADAVDAVPSLKRAKRRTPGAGPRGLVSPVGTWCGSQAESYWNNPKWCLVVEVSMCFLGFAKALSRKCAVRRRTGRPKGRSRQRESTKAGSW